MKWNRVLAIGAHTDDIELGCGAFLHRLHREGSEIQVIAFSRAEASLPAGAAPDLLEREFRASMDLLALGDERVLVGSIPVRHFPAHRQEVLETLVSLNRSFQPDLVLTMNSQDTHQDHQVVHEESVRAFRGTSVLGYQIPWNQQQSTTNFFAVLDEDDVASKRRMLEQYASQAELGRRYITHDYSGTSASFYGFQTKRDHAEAYEVIRLVWDEA